MSNVYVNPSNHFGKPAKPYPKFPLFAHANGCWAKKIHGRLHYFGAWTTHAADRGADAALAKYLAEKDDLHAGRMPRPDPEALTVKDLANEFLNARQDRVNSGELCYRSWREYKQTADLLVERFGKKRLVSDLGPEDFAGLRRELATRVGPVRLRNEIQRVRCIFKYAAVNRLTARPADFGDGFRQPSSKTLRLHRARQGPNLFAAGVVRRLLGAAGLPLRAMILLGINCGFGNADCGGLPESALDLAAGWVDFPRPKTGMPRRCPLWPETVAALREALARRPTPKGAAARGLVFLTRHGLPWHKCDSHANPLSREAAQLLRRLGLNGRKGLGFYTLRHTFRTIADEARDQPAADLIMGHEVPHMSSFYRERISDERLRAVTDHVRAWLFAAAPSPLRNESDKREFVI
jgi:integrase